MMKKHYSLSTILSFLSVPALGFLGFDGSHVTQQYACVSLDGVPISEGTEMARNCCSGGNLIPNAPDTCRAGFNTIGAAAGVGAANSIEIAQNALNVAQDMSGALTDYSSTDNTKTIAKAESTAGGDSSALTGSGASYNDSGSTTSGSSSDGTTTSGSGGSTSGSALGSASGSGAGGAGGADAGGLGFGSGSGSGSGSGANGKNGATTAGAGLGNDKDTRLAYVGGTGAGGANGGSGSNAFGNLFGGGTTAGGAGNDKSLNELKLGDANANRDPNALANGDEDGAVGTAEDPADYFKRIDQSANIFKIVSSRYMKKKSLFKVKAE